MLKTGIIDRYYDDDLSSEKTLNVYNVVTLIKFVFKQKSQNHNHYYYQMFIQKYSHK